VVTSATRQPYAPEDDNRNRLTHAQPGAAPLSAIGGGTWWGLYTLHMQLPHGLIAPGFNP